MKLQRQKRSTMNQTTYRIRSSFLRTYRTMRVKSEKNLLAAVAMEITKRKMQSKWQFAGTNCAANASKCTYSRK